jgi:hypothetical protein
LKKVWESVIAKEIKNEFIAHLVIPPADNSILKFSNENEPYSGGLFARPSGEVNAVKTIQTRGPAVITKPMKRKIIEMFFQNL